MNEMIFFFSNTEKRQHEKEENENLKNSLAFGHISQLLCSLSFDHNSIVVENFFAEPFTTFLMLKFSKNDISYFSIHFFCSHSSIKYPSHEKLSFFPRFRVQVTVVTFLTYTRTSSHIFRHFGHQKTPPSWLEITKSEWKFQNFLPSRKRKKITKFFIVSIGTSPSCWKISHFKYFDPTSFEPVSL